MRPRIDTTTRDAETPVCKKIAYYFVIKVFVFVSKVLFLNFLMTGTTGVTQRQTDRHDRKRETDMKR
jgi:hypothetical protein